MGVHSCVKLIDSKNSRITAIEINVSINNLSSSILLASVYMPVDPGSNSDEDFEFVCGCLNALITDSHVSGYIFAGDFNFRPNSTRLDFIVDCLAPHCAVMADLCILEANNFTYISDVHSTTSWIDHIIVNHSLLCKISCMSIDYDSVASDHRPLSFKFDAETSIGPTATNDVSDADITYISNWEACSMANRSSYSAGLDELLQSVHMPSLCCIDKCTDSSHKKDIDQYLESICGQPLAQSFGGWDSANAQSLSEILVFPAVCYGLEIALSHRQKSDIAAQDVVHADASAAHGKGLPGFDRQRAQLIDTVSDENESGVGGIKFFVGLLDDKSFHVHPPSEFM